MEFMKMAMEHLDLPAGEAAKLQIRTRLMRESNHIIVKMKKSQRQLAKELNIPQSRLSGVLNGEIDNFTIDGLVEILTTLGYRVEVSVRKDD